MTYFKNFYLIYFPKIANDKKALLKMVLGTISYRASELWNLLPAEIKRSPSLSTLKKNNECMRLWRLPLQAIQNVY